MNDTINDRRLRAWWWYRQGLAGSLAGAGPSAVLGATGWARSVGGANPYLTLFARAGTTRDAADAAAADLTICELPAARGCTYVVPACDFALALRVGRHAPEAEAATAARLGVPREEIDELCAAVERTEAFVRDGLGDARSMSLDSPTSRAPRIAALRAAAG